MSKFILIISCILLSYTIGAQSIYSFSVTTIEGANKSINTYQGKKIMFITLPVQQNSYSESLLHSLDSLRISQGGALVIIATPAYEDGYTPAIKNNLKTWYRSFLNNDIIITDGLYTRKTSGSQQHALFKWLTAKEGNKHFDKDITAVGDKFIVWKDGELVGVLDANTNIGGATMQSILED